MFGNHIKIALMLGFNRINQTKQNSERISAYFTVEEHGHRVFCLPFYSPKLHDLYGR